MSNVSDVCVFCRQTSVVHGHTVDCPTRSLLWSSAGSPRVADPERTDLLLKLGDALTSNANLQHQLVELTTECSRLDAELNGLAAVLRPIAQRRECLCVRGDDGLYAHPRCTVIHEEACVGYVRFVKV